MAELAGAWPRCNEDLESELWMEPTESQDVDATGPEPQQVGPQVGERWAYRAKANDPLVEV